MKLCYLDHCATTPPSAEVVEAMRVSMETAFYNPSSPYGPAIAVEKMLDTCRQMLLERTGGQRVIFTSGGTEANNLAILGHLDSAHRSGRVLFSAGEHPSVREACRQAAALGFDVKEIPLLDNGVCDMEALESLAGADTVLICLMQVNNETGAIQPLEEAAQLIKRICPEAWLHVDGVQGFLRCPMNMKAMGVDSFSLSGHKIHAPKGIGALALSDSKRLAPCILGGGQEAGLRSGTENTPGIVGLLAAVQDYPRDHHMRTLKVLLYEKLKAGVPELIVNGPAPDGPDAADHILNLSFPPVRAETMLHALEARGVYVSQASACSAKKNKHSQTLSAMGVPVSALESALRFSLSPYTTREEIDMAVNACLEAYQALRPFTRR
ncbi:MAG: cysteine desulfurase [Clostridiales bacterium]|nr:cysteine desulfurase [Clostridiales bacterium]